MLRPPCRNRQFLARSESFSSIIGKSLIDERSSYAIIISQRIDFCLLHHLIRTKGSYHLPLHASDGNTSLQPAFLDATDPHVPMQRMAGWERACLGPVKEFWFYPLHFDFSETEEGVRTEQG